MLPLFVLMYYLNTKWICKLISPVWLKLVYTETVDSIESALGLARQTPNIFCYLPLSNSEKKWRLGLHPWQVKKSSKLIFCGVYYLTVLVRVYTKTTIPLSVGGQR